SGTGPGYDHLYVVVSRTIDGGVTWESVTIPGDWGGTQPVLTFADAEDGFLLLSGLRGGGGSVIFATTDGGATWQRVGGAPSLGSIFSARDSTTLWAGNEGDAGPVARPILDVSRDGGRTWGDAGLPGLVGDIFVNDNPVAPPVFSGQDGAVAVIAASTDTSPMVRFYRSSDGGRTWVLAAQVHIGESGSTGVAVVDPLHYVVIDSHTGQLKATSDGGVTWQPAASSGLGAALRLRFWDPGDGAAVVQMTNGQAPAAGLLRTTDGGRTWSPVVITAPSSATPSPDVTARYPDGIPSTFLGQRVYRPSDLLQTVPTGPFLLGGWNAGAVVSACIPIVPGASNPPCPSFEALAETRGGPMVIAVRWGALPVPGAPALVLRVTAEPAPTCVSIPPGGCPGPSVTVQDVLWAGDPSASASPLPSPSPKDSATARSVASQYETARASGDWQTAWSMLSAYSQSVIGSFAKYVQRETAYNASGGTTFEIQDPTQSPDLLAPAFLGQAYVDVQTTADISRAWLVFVEHPNVRGASAATTGLLIARIDEHWYVWISH
ncbi:MAG: WD40/YVTN/BNR-like repeat-containing protein, partial [Acidimicrobiales bacterium]